LVKSVYFNLRNNLLKSGTFPETPCIRHPESNADALKHAGILTIGRILLIYICCALVSLVNELPEVISLSEMTGIRV